MTCQTSLSSFALPQAGRAAGELGKRLAPGAGSRSRRGAVEGSPAGSARQAQPCGASAFRCLRCISLHPEQWGIQLSPLHWLRCACNSSQRVYFYRSLSGSKAQSARPFAASAEGLVCIHKNISGLILKLKNLIFRLVHPAYNEAIAFLSAFALTSFILSLIWFLNTVRWQRKGSPWAACSTRTLPFPTRSVLRNLNQTQLAHLHQV